MVACDGCKTIISDQTSIVYSSNYPFDHEKHFCGKKCILKKFYWFKKYRADTVLDLWDTAYWFSLKTIIDEISKSTSVCEIDDFKNDDHTLPNKFYLSASTINKFDKEYGISRPMLPPIEELDYDPDEWVYNF
jgi:hypothetical protein